MLSSIVGHVDINAAAVLVVAFLTSCVVITAMIIKRRSRKDVENEYSLAVIKHEHEHQRAQYVIETDRMNKFKMIEQGLITSHKSND